MKYLWKNHQIIAINGTKRYSITETATIRKFKYGLSVLPGIDELLDWRFSLMNKLETDHEYPKQWWIRELCACDYLLDLNFFDPEDIYINETEISEAY